MKMFVFCDKRGLLIENAHPMIFLPWAGARVSKKVVPKPEHLIFNEHFYFNKHPKFNELF